MKLFSRNKNKGKLTMDELLSDDFMQYTLENFKYWTHAESPERGKAWEVTKLDKICAKSNVLFGIMNLMDSRFSLGEYHYNIEGNRIERTGPSIKLRNKSNPLVKLSSPFRIRLKKKPKRGIVTSVK